MKQSDRNSSKTENFYKPITNIYIKDAIIIHIYSGLGTKYRLKTCFIKGKVSLVRNYLCKNTVGGLLSTGHLSNIGTLLMAVKSIGFLKTLFFLPCVPESMAFLTI